jgi:hypothetical protein
MYQISLISRVLLYFPYFACKNLVGGEESTFPNDTPSYWKLYQQQQTPIL